MINSVENFYIDSFRGKPDWEVFHGTACVFARLENSLSECLKPYQLTPVKFNTLMLIKHRGLERGLSQNEISHHLIVTPSNITRLLDRLKKEGLITRCAQKGDRRVNLIKITPKGSVILDAVWKSYEKHIKNITGGLKKEELSDLSRLLLKWYSTLEK